MKCHDKLSGERFDILGEDPQEEIEEYLRDALCEGETVAYDVDTDTGENYDGEVTG